MRQQWYSDGGVLTTANASAEPNPLRFIDEIGGGLPQSELPLFAHVPGGMLGAAARRETAAFECCAHVLSRDGWVRARLGLPPVWADAREEAAQMWEEMEPGVLMSADGDEVRSRSTSLDEAPLTSLDEAPMSTLSSLFVVNHVNHDSR